MARRRVDAPRRGRRRRGFTRISFVLGLALILSQAIGVGAVWADPGVGQGDGQAAAATADSGTALASSAGDTAEATAVDESPSDPGTLTGDAVEATPQEDSPADAATVSSDAVEATAQESPPEADPSGDAGAPASDSTTATNPAGSEHAPGTSGKPSSADATSDAGASAESRQTRTSSELSPAALTGSNVSIDLMAAGPFSYDHVTLAGTGPNLPRVSDNKTIDKTTGVVESLEGGDFKCGDDVVFFAQVTSVGGTGSGTLTFDVAFLAEPTGQPGVGFDDIVDAQTIVNPQDDAAGGGNVRDGDETVSLSNEHLDTSGPKDQIVGTVTLTDLDAGETVVVRIVGHLGCAPGTSPTGNLQTDVLNAKLDGEAVSVGNQTIPFKKVEDIAQPGITVLKTADDGTVQAGNEIGFTITVTNPGNVTLSNVTLTDPLPSGPGVTWTVASTSGDTGGLTCAIATNTLTCTKSSLAAGASFTVHVTSPTSTDSCKTYDNTATVTSGQLSGSSSDSIVVEGCGVDLALTKDSDVVVAAVPGDSASFSIVVTNNGNATAHDVTVIDTVPAGLDVVDASFTGGSNGPGTCDISGQDVSCDIGSLLAGASATVTIDVTVGAGACPSITNTATVTASNETGSSDDNSDSTSFDVVCGVNLTLDKSANLQTVNAGGNVTFTITATNAGNSTAQAVHVTDTMPAGVTINSASFTGGSNGPGTCDVNGQSIDCDLGTLGAGQTATVTIGVTVNASNCPSITNNASVSADNESGDTEDNSDSVTVGVVCPTTPPPPPPSAPLGIQIIKDGPALAHVGETITYSFDVSLTTSTPLTSITVTDPICSAAPILGSKTGGDQDAWLEPGETWHFHCTHKVTAADPDPLPNTATARGTDSQGRSTSDTDDHLVDIIHPAIRVVKTASRSSITPGQTVTYTYKVTNVGDVPLFNVSVDDDKLGHICSIPRLDVDETETCTKDFTAPESKLGPLTNVVVAAGKDVTGFRVEDEDRATIDVVLGVTITPTAVATSTAPTGTAFTGSAVLPLVAMGLGLLAIGTGLIYLGRRREDGSPA
jgi:uncharacterized repeat protein (TIGR01451 family)